MRAVEDILGLDVESCKVTRPVSSGDLVICNWATMPGVLIQAGGRWAVSPRLSARKPATCTMARE